MRACSRVARQSSKGTTQVNKTAVVKRAGAGLSAAKAVVPEMAVVKDRAIELLEEVGDRAGGLAESGKENWQGLAGSLSAMFPGAREGRRPVKAEAVVERARALPEQVMATAKSSVDRLSSTVPSPAVPERLASLSSDLVAGARRLERRRLLATAGSVLFVALLAGLGLRWLRKAKMREQMAAVDQLAETAESAEAPDRGERPEKTAVIIRNGSDPGEAVTSRPNRPLGR